MRVLVITKGHPFEAEPFFEVFDALGLDWEHVEHPEALERLAAEASAEASDWFDALVFYDMPGIEFTRSDPPVRCAEPTPEAKAAYRSLLDAGRGLVFLHHAVAGWPAWEEYAHIVGGRFHYQPGSLDGVAYPDSGYRHGVTHTVEVVEPTHPVCAGLDATFDLTDEVYLYPVLVDEVVPLLRSSHRFEPDGFYSADLAIRGTRNSNEGWTHPPGSDLVGWIKNAGNSPVAYLQFGDGPDTYADPNFRRLLGNAIDWAASDEARLWARSRARRAEHTA